MQVVGVVSNGTGFIYVNGVLSASGVISQPSYPHSLQVGEKAQNNSDFLGGSISDTRLYNRALSANEVAQLYAYEASVPVITAQPQDQAGTLGGAVTFSVTVTGEYPLTYQWFKDGMIVAGATNASLSLTNIQPNRIGYYSVGVSNGVAGVLSTNAALTIPGYDFGDWSGLVVYYPFNGNANDASGNGNNGTVEGAMLTTDRSGTPNSAYYFNGVRSDILVPEALFGATIQACTVSMWITTDSGPYSALQVAFQKSTLNGPVAFAILTNYIFFGIQTTSDAFINAGAPLLTNSTMHVVGVYQKGQSISIYINGVLVDSVPVPNENLYVSGFPLLSSLGSYHYDSAPYDWFRGTLDDFRVYTRALSASDVQQLYVYESSTNPPSITAQPQSVTLNAHNNASFNVRATGTMPLSYQWSLNGTNISGATATSLTLSNVTQQALGAYAVVVNNAFGSVSSSNAMLSMYPFLAAPFGGLVTDWSYNATLSMQAWGTGPLRYQWFDNGVAVLNATNQTLNFPSIQFTNAGLYSVVVSSPFGSVTNTPQQVVVNPAGVSLGMYAGVMVTGTVGYAYAIQATTDLSKTNSWSTVATLTLVQPVQLWVDISVSAFANPHRYYRVMPAE